MNLLLVSEIRDEIAPPAFGGEFGAHMERKRNPAVLRASLTAWGLLANGLRRLGWESLPAVRFGERGKPEFVDCPLHFSLAHSGSFAAALISDMPCGVDIERIRPDVAERLRARCLSSEELRRGLDFFECWTKKECIGKRTGDGVDGNPAKLDTLDPRWANQFFSEMLIDSTGQNYALAALCEGVEELEILRG